MEKHQIKHELKLDFKFRFFSSSEQQTIWVDKLKWSLGKFLQIKICSNIKLMNILMRQ